MADYLKSWLSKKIKDQKKFDSAIKNRQGGIDKDIINFFNKLFVKPTSENKIVVPESVKETSIYKPISNISNIKTVTVSAKSKLKPMESKSANVLSDKPFLNLESKKVIPEKSTKSKSEGVKKPSNKQPNKTRDQIMNIQKILVDQGYDISTTKSNTGIDGIWGKRTEAAFNDYISKLRSLNNNKLNTISSTDVVQPEVEEKIDLRKLFNIPADYTTFFKKGGKSKIYIKPENRGKFTEYCGGKVTQECISKGKNSFDPKIRKRATFAANARKWKHQKGGKIKYDISDILDQWKKQK